MTVDPGRTAADVRYWTEDPTTTIATRKDSARSLVGSSPICVGCGSAIVDRFMLKVAPDMQWHSSCLKCTICSCILDETANTCYIRHGRVYCKKDYTEVFGTKCSKCGVVVSKDDYIMRVQESVYHLECFHCVICYRLLQPGEQFAKRDEGLFCKMDIDFVDKNCLNTSVESCDSQDSFANFSSSPIGPTTPLSPPTPDTLEALQPVLPTTPLMPPGNNLVSLGNGQQIFNGSGHGNNNVNSTSPVSSVTTSISGGSTEGGNGTCGAKKKKDPKTTRVRTVLNEKQLYTLRTCYNANPRPDALMKEQLVEMTDLSPRVIRVWFQNKRCKDKKKQILIKQLQHHHQEKNQPLPSIRQGLGPIVSSAPMRHNLFDPRMQPIGALNICQPPPPSNRIVWQAAPNGDFETMQNHRRENFLPGKPANMNGPLFQPMLQQQCFATQQPQIRHDSLELGLNFLGGRGGHDNGGMKDAGGDSMSFSPLAHSDLSSPSCSD